MPVLYTIEDQEIILRAANRGQIMTLAAMLYAGHDDNLVMEQRVIGRAIDREYLEGEPS